MIAIRPVGEDSLFRQSALEQSRNVTIRRPAGAPPFFSTAFGIAKKDVLVLVGPVQDGGMTASITRQCGQFNGDLVEMRPAVPQ